MELPKSPAVPIVRYTSTARLQSQPMCKQVLPSFQGPESLLFTFEVGEGVRMPSRNLSASPGIHQMCGGFVSARRLIPHPPTPPQADDAFTFHLGRIGASFNEYRELQTKILGHLVPRTLFHVRVSIGSHTTSKATSSAARPGCLGVTTPPCMHKPDVYTATNAVVCRSRVPRAPAARRNPRVLTHHPLTPPARQLLRHVRLAAARIRHSGTIASEILANELAMEGYTVSLQRGEGGGPGTQCFKNLRHTFLTVQDPDSQDSFIVEVRPELDGFHVLGVMP